MGLGQLPSVSVNTCGPIHCGCAGLSFVQWQKLLGHLQSRSLGTRVPPTMWLLLL